MASFIFFSLALLVEERRAAEVHCLRLSLTNQGAETMSQVTAENLPDLTEIVSRIVTEDDEPVDNLFSDRQQRLLVETLYSAWTPPPNEDAPQEKRTFLAAANIGIFSSTNQPPLVPDVFVSLDVEPHRDWYAKEHRSYFLWEFGKAPEVVVEVVSNQVGRELDEKLRRYARMDVSYYVVYDPQRLLSDDTLRVYERGFGRRYRRRSDFTLPDVGLGLILWNGVFEGREDFWLRWCDAEGRLIPTPDELAAQAREQAARAKQKAAEARKQAAEARKQAAQAEERAARLAAKLRELGVDPEQI
jgi:Uma2 family endonuclease